MDWSVEEHQTADRVTIALHRLGDRSAVPVLLVPGTFSNHTFWFGTRGVGFARELAAAGYEAIALDPRGHGDSQRPGKGEAWDFDDWIRYDVATALRAIIAEGRRPFVVGHSAGGASALTCIAAYPEFGERLRGLVIVSTPIPWLQPWRGVGAWLIRATSKALGRFPARLLKLGPEDELEGVMTQWMSWNLQGHWRGADGMDYEVGMRQLDLPLLVVVGAGDRFFCPPAAARGLFDLIGSADKTLRVCGRATGLTEDFDHVSILIGRNARQEVWPIILHWLAAKD